MGLSLKDAQAMVELARTRAEAMGVAHAGGEDQLVFQRKDWQSKKCVCSPQGQFLEGRIMSGRRTVPV